MPHQFAQRMFTPSVKQLQSQLGSRNSYASMDEGADYNGQLSVVEADFIAARDSFYMASVSESGWPYAQHRGGPKGFVKVLDEKTIGFADYSGNRQYISTGNFQTDNRVSLILMDYPNRTRLKVLGRVEIINANSPSLLAKLEDDHYRARVERGIIIHIEAFDWNCPQHIQPRYTQAELDQIIQPLKEQLKEQLKQAQKTKTVNQRFGDGPIPFVITAIKKLTNRVTAYELQSKDGQDIPAATPGAHIKLPILVDGELIERHYSIANVYPSRNSIEVAVQREDKGNGGSIAIHQQYDLGTALNVSPPENFFPLSKQLAPVVLIAGGIGITAIKAMAEKLMKSQGLFGLHYAGRSRQEMAYLDELESHFGNHLYAYPSDEKKLNLHRVFSKAPHNSLFYLCGPERLIEEAFIVANQLNISSDRIRIERFTPQQKSKGSNPNKPFTVKLHGTEQSLKVSSEQTLLDALLDANINTPFGCKTGTCRSCVVEVIAGEVEHHDSALSEAERNEQKLMCPCVSRAKDGDITIKLRNS